MGFQRVQRFELVVAKIDSVGVRVATYVCRRIWGSACHPYNVHQVVEALRVNLEDTDTPICSSGSEKPRGMSLYSPGKVVQ